MPRIFLLLGSSAIALALLASPALAERAQRGSQRCQHTERSHDPMVWNEGYGVATCKKDERRYDTYRDLKTRPRNVSGALGVFGASQWKGAFSGYDRRSDDRYDRRERY